MLGVTADQQREHTLKYMAQQTRMGMMQGKSQEQLIKGAAAYVEELDKLSMLTGATRKEQEEARAAVMAEEELRAAMLQAEIDGDTDRQKQLKAMADYSAYLRVSGDTRGATGVAKYAAAGGPVDEASAAAMITYGKGIEAALNGKPIAEIIKQGNESSKEILKQMAGTKSVNGDVSGLVTGKFGTMIDNTKMIDEAVKLSEKTGKTFDQALKDLQEERKNGDQTTKINVEAGRLQQSSAQMIDSAVQKFNYSAELNVTASQVMQKAINKFTQFVGTPPVPGGGIEVNRSVAPTPASTPAPTPVPGGNSGSGSAGVPPGMTPGQRPFTNRPVNPETPPATPPASPATPPASPPAPVPASPPAPAPASPPAPAPASPPAPAPASPPIAGTPVIQPNNKKTAGQLIRYGSGSGDKEHFDMLNPDVRVAFMKMVEDYGKNVSISSSVRTPEEQQKLWDKGTVIPGNVNTRMLNGRPVAKPGTSNHEKGRAIDLSESIVSELKTTASSTGDNLLKAHGFNSPANDPIHIQKARFGGAFDGPEAGYPVMLHGKETVIPTPKLDAIKNTAESVTKTSLGTQLSSVTPASNNNNESVAILESLYDIMTSKFDQMITQMERSTDIQSRLLNNSMV
jgi:hypothetical protein